MEVQLSFETSADIGSNTDTLSDRSCNTDPVSGHWEFLVQYPYWNNQCATKRQKSPWIEMNWLRNEKSCLGCMRIFSFHPYRADRATKIQMKATPIRNTKPLLACDNFQNQKSIHKKSCSFPSIIDHVAKETGTPFFAVMSIFVRL